MLAITFPVIPFVMCDNQQQVIYVVNKSGVIGVSHDSSLMLKQVFVSPMTFHICFI